MLEAEDKRLWKEVESPPCCYSMGQEERWDDFRQELGFWDLCLV